VLVPQPMARTSTLAALLCLSVAACGPGEPAKNPRLDLKGKPVPTVSEGPKLPGPPALPSVIIAELADASTEVHFARNGARGLLLSRKGGRWLTGPVHVDREQAVPGDHPKLRDVAPAPAERAPLSLVAFGEGFLLAWSRPTQGGDEVWAQELTVEGEAVGQALRIGKPHPEIRWVDAVVDRAKATLVWEVRRGDSDEIHAVAWSPTAPATPQVIAEDVLGWHAVAGPDGTAIVWVKGTGDKGRAMMVTLGKDGRAGKATALTPKATAFPDVQLTRVGSQLLAAWTDERTLDPHVWLARLDGRGALVGETAPAVKPVGRQSLVALTSTEDHTRGLLAWEEGPTAATGRQVEMAMLGADGRLGTERAALELHGEAAAPHIVPDGKGFAALTLAPLSRADEPAADQPAVGPVFVRFDGRLAVRSAEPIRVDGLAEQGVGQAGVPAAVRGLSCAGGLCSLLASGGGSPALLALVNLPIRRGMWRAPVAPVVTNEPPTAEMLSAVAEIDAPLADLAAVRLHDGRTLVAWITHFAGQAGQAGPAPPGATLAYRFVAADGTLSEPTVLSKRAVSIGGVDLVAMAAGDKGVAVLGWVGPSNKASQVYLTKIDSKGGKVRQKVLTRANRRQKGELPNEVYDVDLVARKDGGVIATWTDTRHGNPEVFVARVNGSLERRDRVRRITDNATASVEPTLALVDDQLMLLWADGSGAESDLFLRTLHPDKLVPKGPAVRLHDANGRCRAPRWAGESADRLAVHWIEESAEDESSKLRLVALDPRGRTITAVRDVTLPRVAQITSATVGCTPDRCRGVLSGAAGDVLEIGAFETRRELGGPVRSHTVARLEGATAQDLFLSATTEDLGVVLFVRDRANGSVFRKLDLRW
jgi:hypothetical protein